MVRAMLHVARFVFIVMCIAAAVLAALARVIAFAFALALMLAGRPRRSLAQHQGMAAR